MCGHVIYVTVEEARDATFDVRRQNFESSPLEFYQRIKQDVVLVVVRLIICKYNTNSPFQHQGLKNQQGQAPAGDYW